MAVLCILLYSMYMNELRVMLVSKHRLMFVIVPHAVTTLNIIGPIRWFKIKKDI